MNEEISKLIDLQELDSEISGFDRQVREKKEALVKRKQAIADKEVEVSEQLESIATLEQQQREVKGELEDAQVRIKDRQNKMMQVQTSREHQALLKEIEDNKRLIKEKEERLLQLMERLEALKATIKELQNLCKGEKKSLTEDADKVESEIAGLMAKKEAVVERREKLALDLQPALLKRYNILLTKRGGSGIVRTVDGVCQGCFMTIPAQQFNEVRKGQTMQICPTCNRILYYREQHTAATVCNIED